MTVRRYCSIHNIHRTTPMSDVELDSVMLKAVAQVSLQFQIIPL